MKKTLKDALPILLIVGLLLFVIFDFSVASALFTKILTVAKPVFVGVVIAMILSVPYDFFEKKVFRKIKKYKIKRFLSLFLTFTALALAIALIAVLVLPQSVRSVREIASMLSSENAWNNLAGKNEFMGFLVENGKKLYDRVAVKISDYLPKIISVCKDFFTGVYNVVFGAFIAVLLLVGRDSIKRQFGKTLALLMSEEKTKKVFGFIRSTFSKFSKYLGGQVTEAFILGIVTYLVMLLLKIPYPALVGLVIGFVNLIPIVGAYVGGAVCFVLIFAVDPVKAFIFVVADFVLQQVESFTTYPVIVGKYVGLGSFWITVSVLVWGGLFGFWGLILGVPLTAVLQDALRAKSHQKRD